MVGEAKQLGKNNQGHTKTQFGFHQDQLLNYYKLDNTVLKLVFLLPSTVTKILEGVVIWFRNK